MHLKPRARKKAAAAALIAVVSSAADNIFGGLYDESRDAIVHVDGLLALLGEAMVFVNRKCPTLVFSAPLHPLDDALEEYTYLQIRAKAITVSNPKSCAFISNRIPRNGFSENICPV